jgi:hypothetical protein
MEARVLFICIVRSILPREALMVETVVEEAI